MEYKVDYEKKARQQLKKLDPNTLKMITSWVDENLVGCTNPRAFGKALTANFSGKWRYRVGNYRLISDISDETLTILVVKVGHRKNIYLRNI
ncbi:MAG: type II toxin-antitoxin system RelE/ParE family toxin [Oscillospiraceae bacterium]|jgi:mRNA interferase RelE/StbE|nr:type II toxin-antitoxin system RelE/ParE family toxin [Oscillospiraceae bacterium]